MTWITDEHNNRAYIERWGNEEKARASLATLEGCSDCSDCSDCSRCSSCSRCSDCSECSRCSDCSGKKGNVEFGMPPVPVIPDIHQKVYAAVSRPNALEMATWHTCGTTHCRGGWVVALAGDEGKALEEWSSTEFAAMQIYKASGAPINPARFYDSNENAMEDMRKLAEGEK